jgi:hypothetical protein
LEITKEQAMQMGAGVHLLWSSGHTQPSAAASEALRKYPSLNTMAEQHEWFAPMLEAVATAILASTLGGKLKIAISALLRWSG